MPADGDIDFGMLQHVTDVEGTGDIGPRDDQRKDGRLGFIRGAEDAAVDPPLGPVRLEALGLVNFFNCGEITMISITGAAFGKRNSWRARTARFGRGADGRCRI